MNKKKQLNLEEPPETIAGYRDEDAVNLRNRYLKVIQYHEDENGNLEGSHQEIKNYLKALADLAKLQHLHKPDKTKDDDDKKKESPFSAEEEARLDARLRETLGDSWIESKKSTSAN